MQAAELLGELADLAQEAGIEVRAIRGAPVTDGSAPAASGVVRVGRRIWVVLCASDSREEQIEVLARALREHAGEFLESRYLPPAVRERLALPEDPI